MSLAAIIDRRRRFLLRSWGDNPLIPVQVESPAILGQLVYLNDPGASGQIGSLPRRSTSNVVMVRRGGDPDTQASCWVAAGYNGYRGAYLAFVREAYGVAVTTTELAGNDVDHMLNRARAPADSTFVRIEAVPSAANQAWGRLFERAASAPYFFANQQRERRTMSWVICAKLAGELPPLNAADTAGIDRLARFFAGLGMSFAEARDGLQSMLNFAYGRR